MAERLMGVETEYAFTPFLKDGTVANQELVISGLFDAIMRRFPCMWQYHGRGVFLQNGGRFYRDQGWGADHLEVATPEACNPWDVVRYVLAGDQILIAICEHVREQMTELLGPMFFKHNVDYSGADTSWGMHESYMTTQPIAMFADHMIPFLVSRIIFTGSGGFHPRAPDVRFMLSPRVSHLSHVTSDDHETFRPIFHMRDAALSHEGFYRLHLLCGESLCSHTAMWLRSATTALVVAMVDGGLTPGVNLRLADPLLAMNEIASDVTCTRKVFLASGQRLSALAIQRRYLEMAEQHQHADFMPPWAPTACAHWRQILDRLERGAPESVAKTLDWAIKWKLYTSRIDEQRRRDRWLEQSDQLRSHSHRRDQLFEIDVRFGQLGGFGVFDQMDRDGVLDHRFPGVDNIEHAVNYPPQQGRAKLRGDLVRRLHHHKNRYRCAWTGVWDVEGKRYVNLKHPFAATEEWLPWTESSQFCGRRI